LADYVFDFEFTHREPFASKVRVDADMEQDMRDLDLDPGRAADVFDYLTRYRLGFLLKGSESLGEAWLLDKASGFIEMDPDPEPEPDDEPDEGDEEPEPEEDPEEEGGGEPEPDPDGDDEEGRDEPGEEGGDDDGQEPGDGLEEAKRVLAEWLFQQGQGAAQEAGDARSPEPGAPGGQEPGEDKPLEGVVMGPGVPVPPMPTGPAESGAAIFANFEGDEFTN
jgi:hypothetical protein